MYEQGLHNLLNETYLGNGFVLNEFLQGRECNLDDGRVFGLTGK